MARAGNNSCAFHLDASSPEFGTATPTSSISVIRTTPGTGSSTTSITVCSIRGAALGFCWRARGVFDSPPRRVFLTGFRKVSFRPLGRNAFDGLCARRRACLAALRFRRRPFLSAGHRRPQCKKWDFSQRLAKVSSKCHPQSRTITLVKVRRLSESGMPFRLCIPLTARWGNISCRIP